MTGNRKLIPFLAFIGVTAVLRALGRITDATCDHQNELALWLFIGANAAEHLGPAARDLLGTIKAKG